MLATFHAEFGPGDQVLTERYQALEHFERAGDPAGQANAHLFVTDALCTGRFKYGAMLWDDLSDPDVRRRASVCQASGDPEGAISSFLEALEIAAGLGPASQGPRAECLAELGETYQAAGDSRSARQAWEQARKLYEGLHHPAAGQMRARLDQVPGTSGPPAV